MTEIGSEQEVERPLSLEKKQEQYTQRFLKAGERLSKKPRNKENFSQAATKLGNLLHDQWRQAYKENPGNFDADGQLKPRWKSTKDEEWLEKARQVENPLHRGYRKNPDSGEEEVDIAALGNDQLPENSRNENEAAAKFAVKQITDALTPPGDILDEGFLIGAAHEVHEEWKRRNTWAHDDKKLMAPYRDLPLDEKLKDIEHVVLAAELLSGINKSQA